MNSGFAFVPFLYLAGALIVGAGFGAAVVTQNSSDENISAESENIVSANMDAERENSTTSSSEEVLNSSSTQVVDIVSVLDTNTEMSVNTNTNFTKTEIDLTSEIVQMDHVKDVESNIIQTNDVTKCEAEYKSVTSQSESLGVLLDEIDDLMDTIKNNKKDGEKSCKDSYDYEVERIESQWESDLNYYNQQEDWYSSNQGLYNLTETADSNKQYLEEEYEKIKDKKQAALKSAKSVYSSCKDRYEWDTSYEKEFDDLYSDQKSIIKKVTSNNACEYVNKMKTLFSEAERLKWSLVIPF